MTVLLWSIGLFAAAFALHLIIWRVRLPKRQTRTLLCVFFGTLAVAETAFVLAPTIWPAATAYLPVSWPARIHVALFVLAVTLAYVVTYSALEADSPSLVMVIAIAGAGPDGLPVDEFQRAMTDDLLVTPRVADLVRDKLATLSDGRYRIAAKGRRLARLFVFYRRLMNAGKGG